MKRFAILTLTLAVLAPGLRTTGYTHGGHDHKVMGTVTTAAADRVVLKDTAGKDVTVKVTKDTKVKATPALKVQEIKAGMRVVITGVENKDKTLTAKSIEVGVAPSPAR